MLYTTTNVQVSLSMALGQFLQSIGYNVHWQATGETDAQTAGLATPLGTITLVPEFPANPQYIVRLKGDSSGPEVIVIPALCLRIEGSPTRKVIRGLGHKDYEWQRHIVVDGFASNEFEHRSLADALYTWFQSVEWKEFPVYNYDANPVSPALLGSLWVETTGVDRKALVNDNEAVKYYIQAVSLVTYIE